MTLSNTSVFTTNKTQAVRLSKAVAFPDGVREVTIRKIGTSRLITPSGSGWAEWFASGPFVSDDFPDRDQNIGLLCEPCDG
jgi:antitoxin VapB